MAHFVTVKRAVKVLNGQETATYVVDGELFFASSNDLYIPRCANASPVNSAATRKRAR
ncbi:hypothetical protein ACIP9X_08280 [Arthrobacter sp. NPDC093125]|uniref:hypothetical protein n=1 Tax=Arthrobacter sp. NPDC093125 TaxID=3363944 RepID=UPI00382C0937